MKMIKNKGATALISIGLVLIGVSIGFFVFYYNSTLGFMPTDNLALIRGIIILIIGLFPLVIGLTWRYKTSKSS